MRPEGHKVEMANSERRDGAGDCPSRKRQRAEQGAVHTLLVQRVD